MTHGEIEERVEPAIADLNALLKSAFRLNGTKTASAEFDKVAKRVFAQMVGRAPTKDELARIGT